MLSLNVLSSGVVKRMLLSQMQSIVVLLCGLSDDCVVSMHLFASYIVYIFFRSSTVCLHRVLFTKLPASLMLKLCILKPRQHHVCILYFSW